MAVGQKPVPPVTIPTKIDFLKWVVHLPQVGIPWVLTHSQMGQLQGQAAVTAEHLPTAGFPARKLAEPSGVDE